MKVAIAIAASVLTYSTVSIYGAMNIIPIPRLPLEQLPVGLEYENVVFPSRYDNITLRGWLFPSGSKVIVVVNGGYQNRIDLEQGTLKMTKDFIDKGYSMLLFDLRGRGESDGQGLSLKSSDRDIAGAVDYLRSRGFLDISIIGFSTGAVSTLIFAQQESINAIILDGCFPNIATAVLVQIEEEKRINRGVIRPFLPGIFLSGYFIYGYRVVNPIDIVSLVQCPILFIHGGSDYLTTTVEAYSLYQASKNPLSEFWFVDNAGHCLAYKTDPVAYIEKVTSFLEGK